MSTRDDFTKKTVDILAKRAGGKCSICECPTHGPNDNPYTATNIGQAAHISAAAAGGPRYDSAISPEVRKSLKNGIWLCSNCHDKIDRNPESYSKQYLQKIKKAAETSARDSLGMRPPKEASQHCGDQTDQLTSIISSIAIVEVRKVRANLASHHGSKITLSQTWNTLSGIDFIDFNRDKYHPEVGKEVLKLLFLLVGYRHSADVYLEVIRHVQVIVDTFITVWNEGEMTEVSELILAIMREHTVRSTVHQSSLALFKNIIAKLGTGLDHIKRIVKKYYQEAIQKKIRSVSRLEIEETDYAHSNEGLPSSKRRRGLGQEDNDTIQYLEKMLELGGVITSTTAKPNTIIEQEIADIGFDSDIL